MIMKHIFTFSTSFLARFNLQPFARSFIQLRVSSQFTNTLFKAFIRVFVSAHIS